MNTRRSLEGIGVNKSSHLGSIIREDAFELSISGQWGFGYWLCRRLHKNSIGQIIWGRRRRLPKSKPGRVFKT